MFKRPAVNRYPYNCFLPYIAPTLGLLGVKSTSQKQGNSLMSHRIYNSVDYAIRGTCKSITVRLYIILVSSRHQLDNSFTKKNKNKLDNS